MDCYLEFKDVRKNIINYFKENNLLNKEEEEIYDHRENLIEILIKSKDFSEEEYGENFDIIPESVYEIIYDMDINKPRIYDDVHLNVIDYLKKHDIFNDEKFIDEGDNHINELLPILLKSKDNDIDLDSSFVTQNVRDIVLIIIIYEYRLLNNYYQ